MPTFTADVDQIVRNKADGSMFYVRDAPMDLEDDKYELLKRPQGPSALQQFGRGAVSGLAGAAPMLIPGAGLMPTIMRSVAESALPMAAETMMQKSGMAPESGADIAAAGLTGPITRGLLGTPAGARGAARGSTGFFLPQASRQAGIGLLEKQALGKVEVDQLFKQARAAGPAPITPIVNAVDKAIAKEASMSTPSAGALKIMKNLRDKYTTTPTADFDSLIDEVQRLQQQANMAYAKDNNVAGKAISGAVKEIKAAMEGVNPTWREASKAAHRRMSLNTILDQLEGSNPASGVRKLFRNNELVSSAFGEAERASIMDVANRVSRIGTSTTMGLANRAAMAVSEVGAEAAQEPWATELLEMMMRNPRKLMIPRGPAVAGAQAVRGGLFRFGEEKQ